MALIITTSFYAFALNQAETKQNEKTARQLSQFESDWLTASLNQDESWIERFSAGKLFVVPFENDAVKSRMRETAEMIDPKLKPEEMKVRISGNITVLMNSAIVPGGNRSYYFLDTFNRTGGKWQIIATHFSRVSEATNETIEQTIMQLERERSNAAVKKDIAALKRIIADDFVGVESSGRIVNKAQTLNAVESSGDDIQSDAPDNIKIRVYGDTAVVTGQFSTKGKNKEADSNLKLLFTNVWAKRDGHWQVVNHQATQIK
jgi:ketosteroid isomerase-like protein